MRILYLNRVEKISVPTNTSCLKVACAAHADALHMPLLLPLTISRPWQMQHLHGSPAQSCGTVAWYDRAMLPGGSARHG